MLNRVDKGEGEGERRFYHIINVHSHWQISCFVAYFLAVQLAQFWKSEFFFIFRLHRQTFGTRN